MSRGTYGLGAMTLDEVVKFDRERMVRHCITLRWALPGVERVSFVELKECAGNPVMTCWHLGQVFDVNGEVLDDMDAPDGVRLIHPEASLMDFMDVQGDDDVLVIARLLASQPQGLCGSRDDHEPHLVTESSLGQFWCTAAQEQRQPYARDVAFRA